MRNVASVDEAINAVAPNRGPWKNPGFTLKPCMSKTSNQTTYPFDTKGNFMPECAPEVLYSWQSQQMLDIYSKESTDKNLLPVERLFLWKTPIGSYGFLTSVAPLRVKLKKTAVFVPIPHYDRKRAMELYGWYGKKARLDTCNYWKEVTNAPEESVFVAIHGDNYSTDTRRVQEYILCSSEAVESWSILSPELFQEMQWEIDQVTESLAGKNNGFDLLIMNDGTPWGQYSNDSDFSYDHYQKNLAWMWSNMRNNKYTKIFSRNVKDAEREKHFSVKRPTYYNRRAEGYLTEGEKILSYSLSVMNARGETREILKPEEQSACVNKTVCDKFLSPDMFNGKDMVIQANWTCSGEFEKRTLSLPIKKMFKIQDFKSDVTLSQVSIDCGATLGFDKPEPPKREILVLSANYGIPGQTQDVTQAAGKFCDGKKTCEYKISSKFMGIKKIKDAGFSIQYTCEIGKPLTLDVPGPAENQVWSFGCESDAKLVR